MNASQRLEGHQRSQKAPHTDLKLTHYQQCVTRLEKIWGMGPSAPEKMLMPQKTPLANLLSDSPYPKILKKWQNENVLTHLASTQYPPLLNPFPMELQEIFGHIKEHPGTKELTNRPKLWPWGLETKLR